MYEISPPESVHSLDITKLRQPDITLWTAWENQKLLGCGTLRELTPRHGEVKSMRTVHAHRGRGVVHAILAHIVAEAHKRTYERMSLKTGSMLDFGPARRLYASAGFRRLPALRRLHRKPQQRLHD